MNFKYILTLCSVLLIGYLGYTIQSQRNAYMLDSEQTERVADSAVVEEPVIDISKFVETYSDYFQMQFDSLHSVGGAMTIVYNGQVVFVKPYGVKKRGTCDSVNLHTRFRLASVSKGFAGVLAVKMAEREVIDLDMPIISYLPSLHLSNQYNQEHVTLRHVLSQSSGLLGYSFDPYVESGLSYNQIYQKLYVAKIDAKPGERYAYQNVIFSLLDTVLQLQTGRFYGDLMKENIFQPLGMTDASVGFSDFVDSKNFAYPHKMLSSKTLTYKVCDLNSRYYCTAPAAGVNASISDMGQWLKAILGYSPLVVSERVRNEIGTPYVPISTKNSRYWGGGLQSKDYGLGWRVFNYKGDTLLYHGGYVQGYRSEVVVWKNKHIGMAMLLNSPNALAQKAVPFFVNNFSFFLDPQQDVDNVESIEVDSVSVDE